MYRSDGGNVFQLMTATNKEKETEVILAYGIRLKGNKQPFPMMFATEKEAKDYTMMERYYYPPDLEVVKIKVEAI